MLAKKLEGAAAAAVPQYVEDVFSTYLYDGNSSTQTITNGIDLSTKGGLVWMAGRSTGGHTLLDTTRGTGNYLATSSTNGNTSTTAFTSFNTDGFSLASSTLYNKSSTIYTSWTFRKQAKFFDVVTYTGDGNTNRALAHSLGSTPGMVIIKMTSEASAAGWGVWHRSLGNSYYLLLNSTAGQAGNANDFWGTTSFTSTNIYLGNYSDANANGKTYVAYLFAHDAGGFGASGSDNVISCGSFTTDGSGNATVDLGYEPQLTLTKRSDSIASDVDWNLFDSMRGWPVSPTSTNRAYKLSPNLSNAEGGVTFGTYPTSTGFVYTGGAASATYIYIAIRRGPMKTPTDATKVFTPTVYTGTNVDNRLVSTTIAPDMVWIRQRNDTVLGGMVVGDRLRGQPYLLTGTTAAEVNDANSFDAQIVSTVEYGNAFSSMSGVWVGSDATSKLNANTTSNNHIVEAFKRAPGFFDVVCYTGNSTSGRTISHNLGVAPELLFAKARNNIQNWSVLCTLNSGLQGRLNTTDALSSPSSAVWGTGGVYVPPTSSVFTVGADNETNQSNWTYSVYLFASVSGVSKVGSYTGNGTSQTINCGFTNGARFVLIKRTDSTGDWKIIDSARGIVSGDDPTLALNSTSAEVTNTDCIDPDSSGFIVNQEATNNLNVNNATYIYLAVA